MNSKKIYNLISIISIVIVISFLFYVYYKSEIIFNGSLRNKYNLYYFLLSLVLFILIFTFFVKEVVKSKIYLILFSLFISFYFIEIILNFTTEKKLIAISKNLKNNNKIINSVDKRSRIQFF
ncbi:hypothetical protein OAB53_04410 [Candidatus Pelagibacter sp.]|nr:hypothetical protein [Candidatus Pelagibacter sp.]